MGTQSQEIAFKAHIAPSEEEQLQRQVQEVNPELERYYLFERDADPDQEMEEQWENGGVSAAAEVFLLPLLKTTAPYPERCRYIGPMGWDLVDPQGEAEPILLAITEDDRRFLIGHATWSEEKPRTLAEHWQSLDPALRAHAKEAWARLIREAKERAES